MNKNPAFTKILRRLKRNRPDGLSVAQPMVRTSITPSLRHTSRSTSALRPPRAIAASPL